MRASRAALLALLALAPAAAAKDAFPRLLADPRSIGMSASYYRHRGENASDFGLGQALPLAKGRAGSGLEWLWDVDLGLLWYGRIKERGYETSDFLAELPVAARARDVSFQAALLSRTSDVSTRVRGDLGCPRRAWGARVLAAVEPVHALRLYGGATRLFHDHLESKFWSLQSGAELTHGRLFLAQDLHWRQLTGWTDSSTVAGLRFPFRAGREFRVQGGYYTGGSPFGQFRRTRDHYTHVGVALDL